MEPIKVLDFGYVAYVEYWGNDERVIESARMSTAKGFQGWDKDEKLLAYLYNNKHLTPFEMCGLTIEVKAPIVVFREWHRHRTQSYNEMSGRYVPLPNENYLPSAEEVLKRANAVTSNKQAQSDVGRLVSMGEVVSWLELVENSYLVAQNAYQFGLEVGVPKELARLTVPVARYSAMRASGNLRNWLAFLTLRDHPAAQKEIQLYARAVGEIIQANFPRTYALFSQGRE